MATYLVEGPNGSKALVETRTVKAAIAHVAGKQFTARVAKTPEAVSLMKSGVEYEDISKAEAETELPGTQKLPLKATKDDAAFDKAKQDQAKTGTSGTVPLKTAAK